MKVFDRTTKQSLLSSVVRAVPVRQRTLFTRKGRLRLRFMAVPALALFMTAGTTATHVASAFVAGAHMPSSFEISNLDADPAERRAIIQKRLQRYASEDLDSEVTVAAAVPSSGPKEKIVEVGKGDTLAGVLQEAGLDGNQTHDAVEAMKAYYDPRAIQPGQKIHLRLDPAADDGDYDLSQLTMDVDALKTVSLQREGDGSLNATVDEKPTVRRPYAKQAEIELSLFGSAVKAGVPSSIIAEAIRIYSWDVDFQRDIRRGDSIQVMYDQVETEDGKFVSGGNIIYARLNVNGQDMPLYRYETADGTIDYYTADGQSGRKALMSTPVDGARLSSGFGARKHPVLGYTKMHKGVDFAAAAGTPIYAAGDGVIEQIGRWSSYGNYIRIRHNSTIKTAYAHMRGFAKGLSNGSRVKQGQVIGYIGTTGRSTGPHLHYEVMLNNKQVNPRTVKLPQGDTLKGKQLAAFKAYIEKIDRQYAAMTESLKMADATPPGTLRRMLR
jgi:murein DD-endopeptidase MepM/ murein hydrolase activator NlpD